MQEGVAGQDLGQIGLDEARKDTYFYIGGRQRITDREEAVQVFEADFAGGDSYVF